MTVPAPLKAMPCTRTGNPGGSLLLPSGTTMKDRTGMRTWPMGTVLSVPVAASAGGGVPPGGAGVPRGVALPDIRRSPARAPLRGRGVRPRPEATPTVSGALIDGRDRYGLEVLHQLIEAELKGPLDVPLQAEPPRAQVESVGDEVQMIAHVERGIRGERRQKVWSRCLELDSPVGNPKERHLLRIADE